MKNGGRVINLCDDSYDSIALEISLKNMNYASDFGQNFDTAFLLDTETYSLKKDEQLFWIPYIKYCPMDKYIKPSPEEARLSLDFVKSKNTKLNSFDSSNISFEDPEINSDTDLIVLATYDGSNELIPLMIYHNIKLSYRIKLYKEYHSTLIKEKLKKEGIYIFKTDIEEAKEEEKEI